MAVQNILTVSKNNGVGILTHPLKDALTFNDSSIVPKIYCNDGTIKDFQDIIVFTDYNGTGGYLYRNSYDYSKSLLYLCYTIKPNSNITINIKSTSKIYLDEDCADYECISILPKYLGYLIKVQNNNFPINIYSDKPNTQCEVI